MQKILLMGICALAFVAASTVADAGARKHWRHYGWYHYGPSVGAAHAQWLYGGNPDAGGGPRGSVQAANNPRASREYGGR